MTLVADALGDLFNPVNWRPETYLVLIVILLAVRVFVPWPNNGVAHFIEEVCLILPAGLLYFFVRGIEGGDRLKAEANAARVIAFERSLGIFVEQEAQAAIVDHRSLVDLVNWVYVWAHWPAILCWIGWMWWRHRSDYPIYRNAVLLSGGAGMIVFALFPVAPPRLMPSLGLVDTISLHSHSYRVLQPPALTNLYAAMPSLHFGWNLLVGIAIVRHAVYPLGRLLGVLLPAAMFSAIVLTANHYVADGLAGGALAVAGLAISARITPRWAPVFGHLSLGRSARTRMEASRSRLGDER